MPRAVIETLQALASRLPTADQVAVAESYEASLPQRLAAAQEIMAAERKAIKYCIGEMRTAYPKFQSFHENAWGKAVRDIQLVVTYQVKAMLYGDPAILRDRVMVWLRTILVSFGMTPRFLGDTYTHLRQGMRNELSREAYALLEPTLDLAVQLIADCSEPAEARV